MPVGIRLLAPVPRNAEPRPLRDWLPLPFTVHSEKRSKCNLDYPNLLCHCAFCYSELDTKVIRRFLCFTAKQFVGLSKVCNSHQLIPNLDSAWLFTKLSITLPFRVLPLCTITSARSPSPIQLRSQRSFNVVTNISQYYPQVSLFRPLLCKGQSSQPRSRFASSLSYKVYDIFNVPFAPERIASLIFYKYIISDFQKNFKF